MVPRNITGDHELNRTYGTHKNLYIYVVLQTIFAPIYYSMVQGNAIFGVWFQSSRACPPFWNRNPKRGLRSSSSISSISISSISSISIIISNRAHSPPVQEPGSNALLPAHSHHRHAQHNTTPVHGRSVLPAWDHVTPPCVVRAIEVSNHTQLAKIDYFRPESSTSRGSCVFNVENTMLAHTKQHYYGGP